MMTTLHVHERVADYRAWRRAFDDFVASPPASGVRSYRIWRGEDDPGLVVVEYTFDSREAAEAFAHNPMLLHELSRSGVGGSDARFEYLDEVAFATY